MSREKIKFWEQATAGITGAIDVGDTLTVWVEGYNGDSLDARYRPGRNAVSIVSRLGNVTQAESHRFLYNHEMETVLARIRGIAAEVAGEELTIDLSDGQEFTPAEIPLPVEVDYEQDLLSA